MPDVVFSVVGVIEQAVNDTFSFIFPQKKSLPSLQPGMSLNLLRLRRIRKRYEAYAEFLERRLAYSRPKKDFLTSADQMRQPILSIQQIIKTTIAIV